MNHSVEWETQIQNYDKQLVTIEELRSKQLEKYILKQSGLTKEMEQLLDRYMQEIKRRLTLLKAPEEQLVMLNTIIEIEYVDDGFIDTYSIVAPEEIDPEQGKISLLSPVGSQLLLAPLHEQIELSTPAGKMTIRVISIKPQLA
ncbi:GreA/GreB family elongation factor [Paenibacillus endoradicis]|uniref:GreA/GreB family elongation factor n=1 Tax=Paenibacillus endoradicis TaxID=2972487 RepID=UPI002158DAC4|nr:GreA/GreB family elongation factor [Paenibacillus endoradicis]MCR8657091.1 GreA/GreB family elongation factor [Paenibacillus endoradicis]